MTQTRKKLVFSWVLILAMVISVISPGSALAVKAAKPYDGYVYVTVERFTLGQGLAAEPKKIGYYKSESMADILERGFGDQLIMTDGSWGAYISGFKDGGEPEGWSASKIPQKILDGLAIPATVWGIPYDAETIQSITSRGRASDSILDEKDYTNQSSWATCIDNISSYGISNISFGEESSGANYHNGSVFRLEYGIYHSNEDLNVVYGTPLIDFPDKDNLIRDIVDYTGNRTDSAYKNAVKVLEDWDATKEEVESAEAALSTTEKYKSIYNEALANLKDNLNSPSYGYEWSVLSISRSGVSDTAWNQLYVRSVEDKIKELGTNVINKNQSTDNSKIILLLNATGGNPENVAGYNLVTPLANYDYVKRQGVNGIIYALLALDSGQYDIPKLTGEGTQTTREMLINGILDAQIVGGGWDWMQTATTLDPDMSGDAIQALAPYYKSNKNVKAAVDKVITLLSEKQDDDGGYTTWGSPNSCSCAKVICGLSALGINPDTDERFIKNDNSLVDGILKYYNSKTHIFQYGSTVNDKLDSSANDQVLYALTALELSFDSNERLFMSEDHIKHGKTIIKNEKEATCTEDGYTGDKVCIECGAIVEEGNEISKKPHTAVEIPAVAPTEEAAGKTAGKKCSVCGEILEAPKDVPTTSKKETDTKKDEGTTEAPKTEEKKETLSTDYKVTSTDATTSSVEYTGAADQAETSVTIQNVVKDSSGKEYTVTKVADGAFANNKKLTDVTIGANVTTIGADAFKNCTKLSEVIIQDDSVTTVGAGAFSGAKALTEIDFSECKLQAIDKNAFSGCKKLKDIKLNGNKLIKVGKNAFKNVKKNAKFTIYAKNKKTYKKVVKLIKKSGAKKVKFTYKKKK